ncbi:Hpt domain-containing protein [Pseudohalocynthiibacter aestuariivivens]|uniref:Hpt domain-containing protein n=1 Tax=Roseovarius pelagicus TaxID=2980108 RepID=A0ABY6D8R5_9RHOB|nr:MULTISPECIES: Hpt domain-containing protein [Rhodobacterales]QIE45550.1 Hpt domain-containing protein [Pseudohalocynthiibacter aestuariivivens]UXX82529.1 Hpt domain-containing protein [Roseovarius pelagicus]
MSDVMINSVSSGIARIRLRFAEESQDRHDLLVKLRAQMNNDMACQEAIVEIGKISHKIAGTAATLGYPDLGEVAAAVDDHIDQKDMASRIPTGDLVTIIDRLIAEIAKVKKQSEHG